MRIPCCSAEWSSVSALCQDCNRFICRDCAAAHRSLLVFKHHRVLSMEKCEGATEGEQPAADEEGTDQPVCEENPMERTSAELQRSLGSIRLMSRQLRESYDRAQEEVGKTFQSFIAALEERREKMLGDLQDLYGARMASIEALERKVGDCIEHVNRFREAVEPDGLGSAEVLGLEQRLDSTAAALQSTLPQMERSSKELDLRFSQKVIEEGVRMVFGQVQAGQQPETAGPSWTPAAVSTVIWERGRALHQDGAEPPRPGDLSELSLACVIGEPSLHPSQSGGGGDVQQLPRMAPLTFRMRREKMRLYHKFGSLGVMEGEFCEPSGVAVNSDSDIIVADANNHRVQVFDRDGRFKFQFGQVGRGDGQMYFPSRVAVSRTTGDIIVIERAPAHQVQVFHRSGRFVRKFGSLELQHPRAVAVDPLGRLVVVECHVMRVVIFDQSGNLLCKFVCSDQLTFPNGVAVNEREEIFISDNLAHCVKVFSYEGAYLRQIGGAGVTNFPVAVCLSGAGEVLVADNHRGFKVTVFTQDGALLKAYESNTKHTHCFDVAWMDGGSVVLASRDCGIHMYHFAEAPPAPADASPPVLPVPPSSLLFSLVGRGGRSSETFEPKNIIPEGTHQYDLMKQAAAALGSGNLRLAVMLPEGEDLDEWVAVHTVDFFNQIHMLYGTLSEFCTESSCAVMSAGPEHEYHWADDGQTVEEHISAPKYIAYLMTWVQDQLDDESLFPSKIGAAFPEYFSSIAKAILRQLFRLYAHIYHQHFSEVVQLGEEAHLNTSFKHFISFVQEFDLVDRCELVPLQEVIEKLTNEDRDGNPSH